MFIEDSVFLFRFFSFFTSLYFLKENYFESPESDFIERMMEGMKEEQKRRKFLNSLVRIQK